MKKKRIKIFCKYMYFVSLFNHLMVFICALRLAIVFRIDLLKNEQSFGGKPNMIFGC